MRLRHLALPALAVAIMTATAPLASAGTTATFGTVTSFDATTGELVVATTAGGTVDATVTDDTMVRLSSDVPPRGERGRGDERRQGRGPGGPGSERGERDDQTCTPAPDDATTAAAARVATLKLLRAKQVKAGQTKKAKVTTLKLKAAQATLKAARIKAASTDDGTDESGDTSSDDTTCQTPQQRRAAALDALTAGASVQRLGLDPRTGDLREVVVVG